MKQLNLKEFQNITGISDASLGCLLKEELLPYTLNEKHQLRIDVESVAVGKLLAAITHSKTEALLLQQDVAIERVATIIRDRVEKILDLALQSYIEDKSNREPANQDLKKK